MKKQLLLGFILLYIFGCKSELQKSESQHFFGIYLIKEGKFTEVGTEPYYLKTVEIDLDTAKLVENPIISDKDIIEYDWDNQTMTITAEAATRIPQPDSFGIPFIVIADSNRCYIGGFWTMLSSVSCPYPIIEVSDSKDGTFKIRGGYPGEGSIPKEDPRFDKRIKNSLMKLGKLKVKNNS